jgi:hypothetical protein
MSPITIEKIETDQNGEDNEANDKNAFHRSTLSTRTTRRVKGNEPRLIRDYRSLPFTLCPLPSYFGSSVDQFFRLSCAQKFAVEHELSTPS